MGRVPAEWHEHQYDDDGRLTHSIVHREPRWTEEDYTWQLALVEERAEECPCCGLPTSEAHASDSEGSWQVTAMRCYAGTARAERQADDEKSKIPNPSAVLYGVRRAPNPMSEGRVM